MKLIFLSKFNIDKIKGNFLSIIWNGNQPKNGKCRQTVSIMWLFYIQGLNFCKTKLKYTLIGSQLHDDARSKRSLILIQKWLSTVMKFHDFSITQIIREVNLLEFWKCKICHFNIGIGSEFLFLTIFAVSYGWNLPNKQNSKPKKWQKQQF